MTITRILPAMLLTVAATAGPVAAQPAGTPYGGSTRPAGIVPSVLPPEQADLGFAMPAGRPPSAALMSAQSTSLDRVTSPIRQASGEVADPVGTLTGQPMQPVQTGAYPSPYYTDGPGCCGPMGRNGRIGYEIYNYTGPTFAFGEGRFARELHTGWMVGGGGKSLFFNPVHDAAWVMDLGWSFQYNRGSSNSFQNLVIHQAPITSNGTIIARQPDILAPAAIHSLDRTNFNFALGRDWWLWGAGSTGQAQGPNFRVGGLVGGRWGTAHVELYPQDATTFGNYQRRQGVTHGFFLASHATLEIPMGTWILFGGLRAEYGYDWMNLVPPLQGNLNNFNLSMTAGIRF